MYLIFVLPLFKERMDMFFLCITAGNVNAAGTFLLPELGFFLIQSIIFYSTFI